MALTRQQIRVAEAQQDRIAQDGTAQVRLVAGPGTGKSRTIEERVRWLLSRGIAPNTIYVISFTRAASRDLGDRIREFCASRGQAGADQVSVSTLHSLALRVLRTGGQLTAYPVRPSVLDNWELENIFDPEFSMSFGAPRPRCSEVRRHHEAFWSTGLWNPPNYIPPNPVIAQNEIQAFQGFYPGRTQTYSCVLPGEIIRQCVDVTNAGLLDPINILQCAHLIVDEYQDLNPYDIRLIEIFTRGGAVTFVAGDDDQSLYSFRFASPEGIQTFTQRFAGASDHPLTNCFRCSVSIVEAADFLIQAHPIPNRIPKTLTSLHANGNPPEQGVVFRWRFQRDIEEAQAIALSCNSLITNGIDAREILILVNNSRLQVRLLSQQLEAAGIQHSFPGEEGFIGEEAGRFSLAVLRILCDRDDYVAHRTLLGLLPGIGVGTCNEIAHRTLASNLRYRDIFYAPLPPGVFDTRGQRALIRVRNICGQVSQWTQADTLLNRSSELANLLTAELGQEAADSWIAATGGLPPDMTLEETRNYLWADNDEQQARILESVYQRLALPPPAGGFLPPKVRIMTMHGAKGLNATVVFIPGLEDDTMPGSFRRPYPGLVLEAARLLYVSVTRARAACILSFASRRVVYGRLRQQVPSQFLVHTNGMFVQRNGALTDAEVAQIVASRNNMLGP